MKKPLIGITAPPGKLEDLLKKSYMQAYIAAIETAGGIPRLLPLSLVDTPTEEIMQDVDGLLLSGGGDVDPGRFGESTHLTLEHVPGKGTSWKFACSNMPSRKIYRFSAFAADAR